MKRYCIPVILAASVALMAVSCQKSAIDPLTGIYAPASEVNLSSLSSNTVEKGESTRTFTLKFSGSSDVQFTLVGNKYFLPANTYTVADAATAKNGNYIGSMTTVAGKTVSSGSVVVSKSGDANVYAQSDVYTISGMLFTADGAPYKISWSGSLLYEPDPEPVLLSVVLSASSNVSSGTNSVTLSLATPGVYYDVDTYSYSGNGNYLAVDLYSADGYLHEGVYTASAAGGVINEGEFGIGWDPGDLWGIGMVFSNWGTCWWTVDGTATAQKITSGTISVSKSGSRYTIEWGSEETYPNWAKFTGAIEELEPAGAPTPEYTLSVEVGDVTDASWAVVPGVKSHTVTLKGINSDEVKGQFVLILSDGVDEIAGTYSCQEYAAEPYLMGNGWDLSAYGWGMGGSLYYEGGETILINPGETLEVVKYAEGLYGFIGSSGYSFVAMSDGYTEPDTPQYAIYESIVAATDNTFTPVAGVETHSLVFMNAEGEYVACFDLVRAEGTTDLSGEYVCTEYAHEDFTFGNGYDLSMWGMGIGGSRYTDAEGNTVLLNAGDKITVSQPSAGVYKISGEGFSFVGEMMQAE